MGPGRAPPPLPSCSPGLPSGPAAWKPQPREPGKRGPLSSGRKHREVPPPNFRPLSASGLKLTNTSMPSLPGLPTPESQPLPAAASPCRKGEEDPEGRSWGGEPTPELTRASFFGSPAPARLAVRCPAACPASHWAAGTSGRGRKPHLLGAGTLRWRPSAAQRKEGLLKFARSSGHTWSRAAGVPSRCA